MTYLNQIYEWGKMGVDSRKVNDNYKKIVVILDKLTKSFKGIKQVTLNDFLR